MLIQKNYRSRDFMCLQKYKHFERTKFQKRRPSKFSDKAK